MHGFGSSEECEILISGTKSKKRVRSSLDYSVYLVSQTFAFSLLGTRHLQFYS